MSVCNYPGCDNKTECCKTGRLKKRCESHLSKGKTADRARRKHAAWLAAADRAEQEERFSEALRAAESKRTSEPEEWARKVAVMYLDGAGTDIDLEQAYRWTKRAQFGGCREEVKSLLLEIESRGYRGEDQDEDDL
jgi:hypothetical protein